MFDNIDDFKKKAMDNKANLKFKNISIPIGDGEQEFRITGIGEKAIKIEKYVKYEDMMDAVMDGKEEGLEAIIMEFIEDFVAASLMIFEILSPVDHSLRVPEGI